MTKRHPGPRGRALHLLALGLLLSQACAAAERWTLELPTTDPVAFRGIADFDKAGFGTGSMAYPAPNVGGLLIGVLVHAAATEAARSSQKSQLQRDADAILVPYQPLLAKLTHAELLRMQPAAPADASVTTPPWRVQSTPVFGLTHDGRALVLENALALSREGAALQPAAFQSSVKIVSAPVKDPDPVAYWTADDGLRLREQSAILIRESVELAVAAADGRLSIASEAQKTHRYLEGSNEKMERAERLNSRCGRMVLRTLRDTLLSVPDSTAAPDADCPPTPGAVTAASAS
jgi:hypothetical protein